MRAVVLSALVGFGAIGAAGSQEYTLTQRLGDKTVVSVQRVVLRESGYEVAIETSEGEFDRIVLDKNRSTLEWRRSIPSQGTELAAVRDGRYVSVSGTFKNRPYSSRADIGDLPWFQFQELSYPALLGRGAAEFWTIGRDDLKATRFRSEPAGTETIEIMGGKVEALRAQLTVRGIPSALFKSAFWLRKSDGVFLRLSVPPILGVPAALVELTAEKK